MTVINMFKNSSFNDLLAILKANEKRIDDLGAIIDAKIEDATNLKRLAVQAAEMEDIVVFYRVEKILKDRLEETRRYSEETKALLARNRSLLDQMKAMFE